jgi:hypothetical protein
MLNVSHPSHPMRTFLGTTEATLALGEWLIEIWWRLNLTAPTSGTLLFPQYRTRHADQLTQPLEFSDRDQRLFARAVKRGYILLPEEQWSITNAYEFTAYRLADAEPIARGVLDQTMPFEGQGGRVLVFHGRDQRSMKLMRAVEEAVSKTHSCPVQQAISDALLTKRQQLHLARAKHVTMGDFLWATNAQIARVWLAAGLTEWVDPEDDEADKGLVRQVQRYRTELAERLGPEAFRLLATGRPGRG